MGKHAELIKNNGFYKKVFDIQVLIEEEIKQDENTVKSETIFVKHDKRIINKLNVTN